MSTTIEHSASSVDNRSADERKQSPPAFLDLADSVRTNRVFFPFSFYFDLQSNLTLLPRFAFHFHFQAARLGTNMPDISAVRFILYP